MRTRHLSLAVFIIIFWTVAGAASAETASVTSPDGAIEVTVTDENGHAAYSVSFNGEAVIAPSHLGLLFRDHHGFDRHLEIVSTDETSEDETWEQPWGERRLVRNHYNELSVDYASTKGPERRMTVRFRVFDDGVGFRYEIGKQKALRKQINIIDELTQFSVGENTTAWWIPSGEFNRYEYIYNETPAGDVQDAHTPITFRNEAGVHFSIHEAALVDYSGMSLQALRRGNFEANLSPWSDGVRVKTEAPFKTPWRTIQISPDAKGLINSDLILNLNEPNKLGDVSWVEPGKYIGIWWAMHINERRWGHDGIHGATTEETKRYIDFAAEHGFKGVLVEGWNIGWDGDWFNNGDRFSFTESFDDFDLEEVSAYGRSKRRAHHRPP